MHLMPINVQLTSILPIFTSRHAYSSYKMANHLLVPPMALPQFLKTFILRLTSLLQSTDPLLPSGAPLNLSSHHRAPLLLL
jgi:hypothetical protein